MLLKGLKERQRQRTLSEEDESLRLMVEKMVTSLALHEVEIARLRESVEALALKGKL